MAKATTTRAKADQYEVVKPLLAAMYDEFRELSKKKPEAVVSKRKIKLANRLLESCRDVLQDEEAFKFLDLIDEDDVPQQSDVVLMLSQYVAAMASFHGKYHGWNGREHDWFLKG